MATVEREAPNAEILRLATAQFGVITRQQALDRGFTRSQITTRCRLTEWEIILPAVYHVRGAPLSWEGYAVAALLWAGPKSCLSHEAAARFWGLSAFETAGIVITSPDRLRPVDGLQIHTGIVPSKRLVRRGSLRVTTVARTILDLASVFDPQQLEAVLDEALRKRLVTLTAIKSMLAKDGTRGRKGTAALKRLVARRDPASRPLESELERLCLNTIKKAGLPLPQQQRWIKDDRGRFARVDFIYEDKKIIIEVDSFAHHSSQSDWVRDMERRNRLTRSHWRVYHVTYWALRDQPHQLVDWLRQVLLAPVPRGL